MHDTYQHFDADTSAGTRRAYAYSWRRYETWCSEAGREPWDDPDGSTFAAFIVAMTRAGIAPPTLRQTRAAIVYRYEHDPALYGRPDPTGTDAARAEMKRLSKRKRRPRKAPVVTPEQLEKILAASAVPRSGESRESARLRHLEGCAVVRLMFDAALRADDAVRVEWSGLDPEPDDDGNRSIEIPAGKTEARTGTVEPATWAALMRWRAVCPTPDGLISTARNAGTLANRIRRLGEFAGVPITGHSMRRGRASRMAREGGTEYEIMAVGGWKTPAVVKEYVDPLRANKAVAAVNRRNGNHKHDTGDDEPVALRFTDAERARDIDVRSVEACAALAHHVHLADRGWLNPAPDLTGDQLEAARNHLAAEIEDLRAEVLRTWAPVIPPPDCEREGCFGLVTRKAKPAAHDRYCTDRCRDIANNERRKARRRAERETR